MAIDIEICLTRISAKTPLVALAEVTLRYFDHAIKIRRCAVFEKAGQRPWAILPHLSIEKSGNRAHVPLIELPTALRKRVLHEILKEFEKQRGSL